jgi:hypothetical protein
LIFEMAGIREAGSRVGVAFTGRLQFLLQEFPTGAWSGSDSVLRQFRLAASGQ